MDKRVETIKKNYFKVDPTRFLDRNIYKDKTNIELYEYVLNHYSMLNIKPEFEAGQDKVIFTILFECEQVHCQHCFEAVKTVIHNIEDKHRRTKAIDMDDIMVIRLD